MPMIAKKTRYPIGAIRWTIYGTPTPKAIVRFKQGKPALVNGQPVNGPLLKFKAKKSEAWEETIGGQSFQYKPTIPLEGPIALGAVFYRPMPKYISKNPAKRLLAMNGDLCPTGKPDMKNLIANVEDALNGLFWIDDAQVIRYVSVDGIPMGKFYSDIPRIELVVIPLPTF